MFCVRFAGVLIAIENRYSFVERLCADYIADAAPDACGFAASATPEEIAAENDGEEGEFSPAYCESLALYRKICTRMLDYERFCFMRPSSRTRVGALRSRQRAARERAHTSRSGCARWATA